MRLALALGLVALLVSPARGYGAYVSQTFTSADDDTYHPYARTVVVLDYNGEEDEANKLSVRVDGSDYLFTDDGAPVDGRVSCSAEGQNAARCERVSGFYRVRLYTERSDDRVEVGPLADPLLAWGGDGDDFIASENPTAGRDEFAPPYDEIDGGPGDDQLLGGPGADLISGGKSGGFACFSPECGGRETIDGRAGDDIIQDSDAVNDTPVDRDVLIGGPGRDTLDYGVRHEGSVHVSLDPATAQWADNEDDISGFEDLTGTSGSDDLIGDRANNSFIGAGGNDVLLGRAGNDDVSGESGSDLLEGGRGRDLLRDDSGDDLLRGGLGSDVLRGGGGVDRLHGHGGADLIRAADGNPERVYCGDGDDTVWAGRRDRLIGCETVNR